MREWSHRSSLHRRHVEISCCAVFAMSRNFGHDTKEAEKDIRGSGNLLQKTEECYVKWSFFHMNVAAALNRCLGV